MGSQQSESVPGGYEQHIPATETLSGTERARAEPSQKAVKDGPRNTKIRAQLQKPGLTENPSVPPSARQLLLQAWQWQVPGCELAIAEFTLMDGIIRTFNAFINPGDILIGYSYAATKRSAKTHRRPFPPDGFGSESDHLQIFNNIISCKI
jgi:hypothetical protein